MEKKDGEPGTQQDLAGPECETDSVTPAAQLAQSQYMDVKSVSFILILVALSLSIFCVGLDNIIIATAIPAITDEFHAINHIGW